MAQFKRKRLVIEPTIQYSLVRQLIFQWTLHLVATLLLLAMLQVLLGGFFQPWQYHVGRIGPTLASLAIAMCFLLPVFILSSLKLSNRFAGPIHRFRRELRRLAEGASYQELKFRENDYWQEMGDELDAAMDALRAQMVKEIAASSTPTARSGIVFSSDDPQVIQNSSQPSSDQ